MNLAVFTIVSSIEFWYSKQWSLEVNQYIYKTAFSKSRWLLAIKLTPLSAWFAEKFAKSQALCSRDYGLLVRPGAARGIHCQVPPPWNWEPETSPSPFLCPALAEHTVFVVSVRNGSQLTGVPCDLRLAGHTSATHTFLVSFIRVCVFT